MAKEIRVGVVGCGLRLQGILKGLLGADRPIRCTAIMDPHRDSMRLAREIAPDARVEEDYRKVCTADDVDWVLIGSWNCHHRQHAEAALNAGKDVFCEKPLATNVEDALAIRDTWRRSGRQFFFGLVLRYSPHYQTIKRTIDSGAIGRVISMEFNETLHFDHGGFIHGDWRRLTRNAGTHLLEKCCHDLDLAHWIVGDLPRRVASFGGCDFFTPDNAHHVERLGHAKNGRPAYSGWPRVDDADPFTAEKDIVDNQVAILEFLKGARATFHTNCNNAICERRMYICGTEGTLRADIVKGEIELHRIGYDTKVERLDVDVSGSHGGADSVLVRALADTMLNGTPPLATAQEGLASTITACAIDRAMESGAVVDVQPDWEAASLLSPATTRIAAAG